MDQAGFVFDERYVEAFMHLPDGHCVLGVKLKPFSAWHRTVLEYVDSPVMTGEPLSPGALRLAVEVCSRSFPDMPGPPRGLWARICAESRKMKDAARYEKEAVAFKAYVEDYVSLPRVMFGGKKGAVESAAIPDMDSTLMDVAIYRFYTGCPRSEPWDIPLGELTWMATAIARTQGVALSVLTTVEEQVLNKLKLLKKEK